MTTLELLTQFMGRCPHVPGKARMDRTEQSASIAVHTLSH